MAKQGSSFAGRVDELVLLEDGQGDVTSGSGCGEVANPGVAVTGPSLRRIRKRLSPDSALRPGFSHGTRGEVGLADAVRPRTASASATVLAPWPQFDAEQIAAASAVLASGRVNYWTGGECKAFEREFAAWCGCSHAIAMANGSLALEAAYRVIGLGAGDELITTPRSFVATASSAVMLGARPVFADVDPDSQAITVATIEPLITRRTRAISVVHLGGWPADMPSILQLADAYGLVVIEDCAQAHGARIGGRSVGSFAPVAAWSFCQDKIMTTGGEGGMVTTSDDVLADAIWSLKEHGKTRSALQREAEREGFRWLHDRFGSNYRLTELQAAIGRIQLRRMADWQPRRRANAEVLRDALADLPLLRIPWPGDEIEHAWYKFYGFLRSDLLADGWSRDRIVAEISAAGVPAFSGSCSEMYRERCFQDSGLVPAQRLPQARDLGDTSLMFLVHPSITVPQQQRSAEVIRAVLKRASR